MLAKVCNLLRNATQANQCKGRNICISWSHGSENKQRAVFRKYDIKDFTPSIRRKDYLRL